MENTSQGIETNGKSKTIKFKLTEMSELIENIKKKFIISGSRKNIPILEKNKMYQLGSTNCISGGHINLTTLGKIFPDFYASIIVINRGQDYDGIKYLEGDINISQNLPFIKLKNVFFQDDYYIFETQDGGFLYANMQEFDEKGMMSNSLNIGKPSLSAENNGVHDFIIEADASSIKIKKQGAVKTTIPGDFVSVIQKDKGEVLIVNKNRFEITTIKPDGTYDQENPIAHNYGTIEKIKTDRNENFILVIGKHEDGTYKLHILNRKTLQEIDTIPDIKNIIMIDDKDDMNCLSKDDKVVFVDTNFDQFTKGYVDSSSVISEGEQEVTTIEDKPRSELVNALKNGTIKISLPNGTTESYDEATGDDQAIREKIRNLVVDEEKNKTLKQLFDASTTAEDFQKIKIILESIKRTPEVAAVHGLLKPIESVVFKKYNQAKLDELYTRIDALSSSLGAGDDFNTLIFIQGSLKEINKERSQISNVAPTSKDKDLKELTKLVDDKIGEYRESHQEDIQKKIETNLTTIKEYLDNLDYMNQITSVYNLDVWKNTEQMISYLDEEAKKKNKEAMDNLIKIRQNQLSKNLVDIQKKKQTEEQVKITDIKKKIGQIKEIVQTVYDEDAIKDIESNDPLVLNIKSAIANISASKSQELVAQLEQTFKERLLTVKYSKETNKKGVKSLDKYGVPSSLYFVPEIHKKVRWELMGKQVGNDIKIYFETNTGVKIEPNINKKILGNFPFQVSKEEFITIKKSLAERRSNGKKKEFHELIEKADQLKKELGTTYKNNEEYKSIKEKIKQIDEKYYIPRMLEVMNGMSGGMRDLNTRPRVPSLNSKTVIGPNIKTFLENIGKLLDQQMNYKEGFIIVESEAGTGKNFKMDILAHLTNRELFHISCNQSMEKEDLLFSPELNSEGSFRQKSELIRGLQTPGAIILLDEINTLKPGIAKLLNPLLAGQRYINDPQLGRICAHPSVLIVGLMNPRYYLGTSELAQEFVDRARIINDDYPEAMEEGFIISKYIDGPVSQMTREEFENFRDKYIVKGEVPNDKKIYNIFMTIFKIMKVAKKVREIYSKTMRGEADMDKELKFVFSIRAGNFIMQDFNDSKNIKKSMEEVILPKIIDFTQKKIAQKIIDEACK